MGAMNRSITSMIATSASDAAFDVGLSYLQPSLHKLAPLPPIHAVLVLAIR